MFYLNGFTCNLICFYKAILISKDVSDLIKEFVEQLRPENMFYAVISQEYAGREGNIKEKWYGTEYSCTKINKVRRMLFLAFLQNNRPTNFVSLLFCKNAFFCYQGFKLRN